MDILYWIRQYILYSVLAMDSIAGQSQAFAGCSPGPFSTQYAAVQPHTR